VDPAGLARIAYGAGTSFEIEGLEGVSVGGFVGHYSDSGRSSGWEGSASVSYVPLGIGAVAALNLVQISQSSDSRGGAGVSGEVGPEACFYLLVGGCAEYDLASETWNSTLGLGIGASLDVGLSASGNMQIPSRSGGVPVQNSLTDDSTVTYYNYPVSQATGLLGLPATKISEAPSTTSSGGGNSSENQAMISGAITANAHAQSMNAGQQVSPAMSSISSGTTTQSSSGGTQSSGGNAFTQTVNTITSAVSNAAGSISSAVSHAATTVGQAISSAVSSAWSAFERIF